MKKRSIIYEDADVNLIIFIRAYDQDFILFYRILAGGRMSRLKKWIARWPCNNTFNKWLEEIHLISIWYLICQRPMMRVYGNTNISDNSAWSSMVWQLDYKKNVILKLVHRWQPLNSGYFYAQPIKLPRNALQLITHDIHWTERHVYLTATNIFPAGISFMSHS